MNKLHTGAIAALAAVGMATAAVAHADPTPAPPPTPDYTWECDTDSLGHTSCRPEAIPVCGLTADKQWVVEALPGVRPLYPAPCYGGAPNFPRAPYPAAQSGIPALMPTTTVPTHVVLPPGYSDGDGEMPTNPTAQDQAFLHNMSRYGPLVLPAGDALFYAEEICRLYQQGHSVAEVQDTMVNNGIPRHVVIEMDGSAGQAYPNCGPDSPSRQW